MSPKSPKGIIDLSADDTSAVSALMQYCYQLDYTDHLVSLDNDVPEEVTLRSHVDVFMLAERYGVSGLKKIALQKFEDFATMVLMVDGNEEQMRHAIRAMYSPSRRANVDDLRKVAVKLCANHVQAFIHGTGKTMALVDGVALEMMDECARGCFDPTSIISVHAGSESHMVTPTAHTPRIEFLGTIVNLHPYEALKTLNCPRYGNNARVLTAKVATGCPFSQSSPSSGSRLRHSKDQITINISKSTSGVQNNRVPPRQPEFVNEPPSHRDFATIQHNRGTPPWKNVSHYFITHSSLGVGGPNLDINTTDGKYIDLYAASFEGGEEKHGRNSTRLLC
ncbi:hypothetical protein PtrSN002B_001783 [Pyrenophora tritici-repentis]|uniref:BTB domain-containing protein n=1 Tax=Pyrenophora tritici-repentis (strain Pt-1C-BFP) TaxID=426418 RepID=B2VTG7_PYRTR|nr:uncharacterized protein PTRG_01931 [Pyrenophora tritici-repentis Pt-1C-BFP]KAG9388821.1 hypothetical protein A1F94_001714 [Pyrenophora tritici-repentis]EDU41369.1 predicted protein [Pyrenophora tritici-repentis Pt-1C-BFP]KAI0581885.1 hypothetical protein Alg215_04428 [Pyrenophora tritici-repentis]KAI1541535.1 hypothetical protein PtrSN001C_004482 [Pyrenophora tritici-repentis]KAI1545833.1 hypothetical protein PtrSN001A_002183 [Pyrenophora tritici-repentis]